jgi:hypothetical protein
MKRYTPRLLLAALVALSCSGLATGSAAAVEETGTTCPSNTGTGILSPGLEELNAKLQNISVKGTLSGCTGSAGSSARYVAHLKTTTALTCATFNEGATAQGTAVLKWGHGSGSSKANIEVTGSPGSGFALTGEVTSGPYAGQSISSTVSAMPVFKGKGEPCTKKNKLKALEVTGTSPLTIA